MEYQTAFALFVGALVVLLLVGDKVLASCPDLWKHKTTRKIGRARARLIEGITGNPDIVSAPIVSYYNKYTKEKHGENSLVVGLHYTEWCGYCKRMKPVWAQVRKNIESNPDLSGVKFIEIDEDKTPTAGITSYPTIIRYKDGRAREYKGVADYDIIRSFILNAA